jgi:hypothetical protein
MSEPGNPDPHVSEEWLQRLKQAQALPPDIPEPWLQRISEASRSQLQLPEIPDSWLCKIKEATKPDLLATILGSSLLVAVIAVGSSALTSYMTNRGAEKLEKVKLQLQAESDQVKKRVQAYNSLAHDLDSLVSMLDAYLRMSEIAAKVPSSAVSTSSLLAQRNKIGLAEKEVLAAEKNVASFDNVLPAEVDTCLERLSLALATTGNHPKGLASLKLLLDQLKQLVSRANDEINKTVAKSPFG